MLSGTGGTSHIRYSQTTDKTLVWEEVAVTQTGSVMSTRIPDRPARSKFLKSKGGEDLGLIQVDPGGSMCKAHCSRHQVGSNAIPGYLLSWRRLKRLDRPGIKNVSVE